MYEVDRKKMVKGSDPSRLLTKSLRKKPQDKFRPIVFKKYKKES